MLSCMPSSESFGSEANGSDGYFHFSCKDEISSNNDENVEVEKVEKGRERNREHAKRTRLRKKAVLEGMKGKLMELQNEASKLQQCFEERNTANILLCLCSTSTPDVPEEESTPIEPGFDPTIKGDIIQQLRTKVRSEAAQKNQQAALIHSMSNSICSPDPIPSSSSFASYTDAAHVDTDCDSDNEDDDAFQPLPKSIVNWKNGTVVSEEGSERKLSDGEIGHLRKERNRVHAKLTRDRKKLFTSRMQQMINSLEKQNRVMKTRLKSLTHSGDTSPPHDRERELDRGNTIPQLLLHSKTLSGPTIPSASTFSSELTMCILEAMNSNTPYDISKFVDHKMRPLILPGSQLNNSTLPDPKRLKTCTSAVMPGGIDFTSFLDAQGASLTRGVMQNDPTPFLGHLGPLSRVRNGSVQFPTSQFSSSSCSFLEAL